MDIFRCFTPQTGFFSLFSSHRAKSWGSWFRSLWFGSVQVWEQNSTSQDSVWFVFLLFDTWKVKNLEVKLIQPVSGAGGDAELGQLIFWGIFNSTFFFTTSTLCGFLAFWRVISLTFSHWNHWQTLPAGSRRLFCSSPDWYFFKRGETACESKERDPYREASVAVLERTDATNKHDQASCLIWQDSWTPQHLKPLFNQKVPGTMKLEELKVSLNAPVCVSTPGRF